MIGNGSMGSMGSMGSIGSMGSMGSAGTGGGRLVDGVDVFPFAGRLAPIDSDAAAKWPTGMTQLPLSGISPEFSLNTAPAHDPSSNPGRALIASWHPWYLAQAVMAEFAYETWKDTVASADPGAPDNSPDKLQEEMKRLLWLAGTERPRRMAEIIKQAEDARPYWANVLGSNPVARPATWTLVEIGMAVGQMVGMHFKYKYQRPRPVSIYPALITPILTPPHPSYPNNHSLQALMMSGCCGMACPALEKPLAALALRVGENREVASVHFASDRAASEHIAPKILNVLKEGNRFKEVLRRAEEEWNGVTLQPSNSG